MTQLIVFLVIVLTALACSLIGNFLVLKKNSLLADAISHAILPGILLAFFLVHSLNSPLFLLLSVLFAVLMAFTLEWISERVRVSKESVLGIIFTFLFALGVILLVQFANNVHLDQDAVLYGQVEFSAWNRLIFVGLDFGPKAFYTMGFALLFNLLLVVVFYKELKLTIFDPVFSNSVGISARKMHYLLLIATSITIVLAFEAVGAILVIALVIIPALTSYLIAKRFLPMLLLTALFAILGTSLGYFLAFSIDGSISGSVAITSFVIMLLVVGFQKLLRKPIT